MEYSLIFEAATTGTGDKIVLAVSADAMMLSAMFSPIPYPPESIL